LIDLAPGVEGLPLARTLAGRLRDNVVRDATCRRVFENLRGSFALVADDGSVPLTLRFDFGRLAVHPGIVGVPDVTVRASAPLLESLGEGPPWDLAGLVSRSLGVRRGDLLGRAGTDAPGRAALPKIYGLLTHPLMVRSFLRLFRRT
jgi:hypothetical protein